MRDFSEFRDGNALTSDKNREALAQFLLGLRSRGITDHRLLSAFEKIPRKNFVPVIHVSDAYAPGQMPIECGQSMTSVSMVARVLSALEPESGNRVLELGTGTGYQAALISRLAKKIVSLERYRTLHEKAGQRFSQLGIDNIICKLEDGSFGGSELGVSDRIVANFAFDDMPRHFIDNLASNGIMIAPIGPADGVQTMKKFVKIGSRLQVQDLFQVRMQPALSGISRAI
ncbi:MAG: protein-L-isoaspartate(D-aspartate) O-methyltransferase [Pseudomonadota bacterium]